MSDDALTISEIEEMVTEVARKYGKKHHQLPARAFRVIIWPNEKWIVMVTAGVQAVIRLGITPDHPEFIETMQRAVDLVARKKMWQRVEVESAASIVSRESTLRRWQLKHGFNADLIPGMLKDHEIITHYVSRVEVVHSSTNLREIVEVQQGTGSLDAARELAKSRLARRVHEAKIAKLIDPFDLPIDHPDWMARTN